LWEILIEAAINSVVLAFFNVVAINQIFPLGFVYKRTSFFNTRRKEWLFLLKILN